MLKISATSFLLVGCLMMSIAWGVETTNGITLDEAIERTLKNNPELATYAWDTRIAEARVVQAGMRPNPEMSLEIEGIRTSRGPSIVTVDGTEEEVEQGTSSGLGEAEYTLSISQLVELGGKRVKRVQAAKAEGAVVEREYEIARAEALTKMAQRYVNVLATQESLRLAQESKALVRGIAKTIAARVEAGHVSPIEETRAMLEVEQATLQVEEIEQQHTVARRRLAAMWGEESLNGAEVKGELSHIEALISLSELRKLVKDSPDIRYWMTELDHQEALLAVEQAQAKPDVEVSLGYRRSDLNAHTTTTYDTTTQPATEIGSSRSRFDESYDESLVLEFSVPLPLFNRNQGKIREAEYQIKKASAQRRAQEHRMYTAIDTAYTQLNGSFAQVERLRSTLLPQATNAYEATQRGYIAGKFGYLDVLEAQRTLIELRQQHVRTLLKHHLIRIDLERLTGTNASVKVQGGQS